MKIHDIKCRWLFQRSSPRLRSILTKSILTCQSHHRWDTTGKKKKLAVQDLSNSFSVKVVFEFTCRCPRPPGASHPGSGLETNSLYWALPTCVRRWKHESQGEKVRSVFNDLKNNKRNFGTQQSYLSRETSLQCKKKSHFFYFWYSWPALSPCSGHHVVFLGLLVDWTSYCVVVLQWAFSSQFSLFLCGEKNRAQMLSEGQRHNDVFLGKIWWDVIWTASLFKLFFSPNSISHTVS